jgi:hypothetical protein
MMVKRREREREIGMMNRWTGRRCRLKVLKVAVWNCGQCSVRAEYGRKLGRGDPIERLTVVVVKRECNG